MSQVLAVPLMRQQIAAYQAEVRKLEAIPQQPEIAEWPDWVFEKLA